VTLTPALSREREREKAGSLAPGTGERVGVRGLPATALIG
jgi:hypothetical protein